MARDVQVVYNILKSVFTKYRALEDVHNDNDNYGNMIQLFIDRFIIIMVNKIY